MSFLEPGAPTGVVGNLHRLLGTLPGCAPAQPWLGIPADPGLGSGGLEALRQAVQTAVVHGEPRLRRIEVSAEAGAEGVARLVVRAEHPTGAGVAFAAQLGDGIVRVANEELA